MFKNGFSTISLNSLIVILLIHIMMFSVCDSEYFVLYRDWRQCFPPEFKPGTGRYEDEVLVEINSKTVDSTIYYTLDGTDPVVGTNVYNTPISITQLDQQNIIKAIAVKEGLVESEISKAEYTLFHNPDRVYAPEFNYESGTYDTELSIQITSQTEGATIYYTTDETSPTQNSTIYNSPIPLSGNGSELSINAYAVKEGMLDSVIVSAFYTLDLMAVPSPEFNIDPGYFTNAIDLEISCSLTDAEIYYTLNGEDPIVSGTLYTGAITLNNPAYPGDQTEYNLSAAATYPGMEHSSTASGTYYITGKVSTPNFDTIPGQYMLTAGTTLDIIVSCATNGFQINYTLDNTDPSSATGTQGNPISIAQRIVKVKAVAHRTGWEDSDIIEGIYTTPIHFRAAGPGDISDVIVEYSHLGYYGIIWCQNNGTDFRVYYDQVDLNGNMLVTPVDIFENNFPDENINRIAMAYKEVDSTTGYFAVLGHNTNLGSSGFIGVAAIDPTAANKVIATYEHDILQSGTLCSAANISDGNSGNNFAVLLSIYEEMIKYDAYYYNYNNPFTNLINGTLSKSVATGSMGIFLDLQMANNSNDNEYGVMYRTTLPEIVLIRLDASGNVLTDPPKAYTGASTYYHDSDYDYINHQYVGALTDEDPDNLAIFQRIPDDFTETTGFTSFVQIQDSLIVQDSPTVEFLVDSFGMVYSADTLLSLDRYYTKLSTVGAKDSTYDYYKLLELDSISYPNSITYANGDIGFATITNLTNKEVIFLIFNKNPPL